MVDYDDWSAGEGWRPWPYREAIRALERAGVSAQMVKRSGPAMWSGHALARGTESALLRSARLIEGMDPPGDASPADTRIECAGHVFLDRPPKHLRGKFSIEVRKGTNVKALIARMGGRERIQDDASREGEGRSWWDLVTPDPSRVQRAMQYLDNSEVLGVGLEPNCWNECDFRTYGPQIDRGLFGTVRLHDGNCMPGPSSAMRSCRSRPVARSISIYSPPLGDR
ncbi:MAG: hypothetical protein WDA27_13120 [Actinomycetota bacterium]